MDLSIREAAALLGRSRRTVRAQAARGEIPAIKRKGHWFIPRHQLPLTETQRRSLQGKAEAVRQTVEAALPSRLARTAGQRNRSIADLDAFRSGARLLAELRAAPLEVLPPAFLESVIDLLEQALLDLAEAIQQFDRELKLAASNRSRAAFARVAGWLLLAGGIPPGEPVGAWVVALETEVIPAVAGFARWADGLGERRR
jgi:excisionase family DNA binding protein